MLFHLDILDVYINCDNEEYNNAKVYSNEIVPNSPDIPHISNDNFNELCLEKQHPYVFDRFPLNNSIDIPINITFAFEIIDFIQKEITKGKTFLCRLDPKLSFCPST